MKKQIEAALTVSLSFSIKSLRSFLVLLSALLLIGVSSGSVRAVEIIIQSPIFTETFNTATGSSAASEAAYDFTAVTTSGGVVSAAGGNLRMDRGHTGFLHTPSVSELIIVKAEMGLFSGTGGSVAPGISIGNRVFQIFPGFGGGAFRIYDYNPATGALGTRLTSPQNINMGFTPAQNLLHRMIVTSDNLGSFDVRIEDAGSAAFFETTYSDGSFVPGAVGLATLHGTANTRFDNFGIFVLRGVPEPSTLGLLLLGGAGLIRHQRRRHARTKRNASCA